LAGTGIAAAAIGWVLTPNRRATSLFFCCGFILVCPGAMFGPIWQMTGRWWSPIDDPRSSLAQIYRQYPLTTAEVAPCAWIVLSIAACFLFSAIGTCFGTPTHTDEDD
jgi:hypothetical protein